ncbi:helix-turn-helix domain-containing protein [Arachidicoccus terrestris]|uniref:helix-turn-helix domain-containing protein n=1 Tax=Arachidicoccus terrestris TaxID=2875539 RepID=UPI001CC7A53A|nr:helix-turn-helix domain-containing protein [Arachidicoccus terrestris]UAY55780.1 helix-turn-helix domain-containing protein [Arachidicoccus terrestris]
MYEYKFEELPRAIGLLHEKVDHIEVLLGKLKPQQEKVPDLLTIAEAAALLGLAVPTIYAKVCHREIPFFKQGKRLYFSRRELLEWIQSGKKKTFKELKEEAEGYFKKRR